MIKAHKIRLNPTEPQEAYFCRASGVARFAWNWALEEYKRRIFPSSKRRHMCEYVNGDLQLSDRVWTCPNCGAEHDWDENGAINIEMEGVSLLAGSGYIGVTPVEFAASALKVALA